MSNNLDFSEPVTVSNTVESAGYLSITPKYRNKSHSTAMMIILDYSSVYTSQYLAIYGRAGKIISLKVKYVLPVLNDIL